MDRQDAPRLANNGEAEQKLVDLNERLTQVAFERFTAGELCREELQRFYQALRKWSQASEKVIDLMRKTGIRG